MSPDAPPKSRPLGLADLILLPVAVVAIAFFVAFLAMTMVPLLAAGLLVFVALPYYREFFPTLSPGRRALFYTAAVIAVFGPAAGAVLVVNPAAVWHPGIAARLAIAVAVPGFLLGAAGLIVGAYWRREQFRMVAALPTSRIASAAVGLVELKGRARSAEPGKPILDVPDRLGEPVLVPGFWLEDDTGRVWVDPGSIPVRHHASRAFGFRVNAVVLTRNARATTRNEFEQQFPKLARLTGWVSSRTALLDGDRVYLVGHYRQERVPGSVDQYHGVVSAAPQQGQARDYRHMFFLSDTSEEAALRYLARGMRRGRLLGWIWVAMALAVLLQAAPRAIPIYDAWSLSEVEAYAPRERFIEILIARYAGKPAEQRPIAMLVAAQVTPPGNEGVFEFLSRRIASADSEERNLLYTGLGKLTNYQYRVTHYLVDGLQVSGTRAAAAKALYELSGSGGFGDETKGLFDAFAANGNDACAALTAFVRVWWAANVAGPVGVELLRRCDEPRRAPGLALLAERAYTIPPVDAPLVMQALDKTGRRAVLYPLVFRKKASKELAEVIAGWAYDDDPATAALAGAVAQHAGIALAATASTALTAALRTDDRNSKKAAARALRAVAGFGSATRRELIAVGLDNDKWLAKEALLTLAAHEPEPTRTRLTTEISGGTLGGAQSVYRVESYLGIPPDEPTHAAGETATVRTADDLRRLWSLSHRPAAKASVMRHTLAALRSPDAALRKQAAILFSQYRQFSPESVVALGALLEDSDADVRKWAADALLKLERPPESIRGDLERAAAREGYRGIGEAVRTILRRYDEPLQGGAAILPVAP